MHFLTKNYLPIFCLKLIKYFLLKTVLLSLLVLPAIVLGQNENKPDELDKKIKEKVDEYIEGQYVKVPKKDFELEMERMITSQISSEINTLLGIILAVITLLSGLSFFQVRRSRALTEKQVQLEINNLTKDALDNLEKIIIDRTEEFEKRINTIVELNKNELQNLIYKNQEQIKKVETKSEENYLKAASQVVRAEEYITNLELERLKELIYNRRYEYPEDLYKTNELLNNVENSNRKYLIPTVVNLLSYIYYDQRKYNEVNDLISKYESEHKLLSSTYINGALTALSDYHHFNSKNQRKKALEYLDKSLELTQGYGQALGLKIEIYLMDYMRAENDEVKSRAKESVQKIINEILKSASDIPAYETSQRLAGDVKVESYREVLNIFHQTFESDIKALFTRANKYAQNKKLNEYFDPGIFKLNPDTGTVQN